MMSPQCSYRKGNDDQFASPSLIQEQVAFDSEQLLQGELRRVLDLVDNQHVPVSVPSEELQQLAKDLHDELSDDRIITLPLQRLLIQKTLLWIWSNSLQVSFGACLMMNKQRSFRKAEMINPPLPLSCKGTSRYGVPPTCIAKDSSEPTMIDGSLDRRPSSKLVADLGETRMAKRARIRCSNKKDGKNPRERITHVGGLNPDGTQRKRSIDQAIKDIESGEWKFYVEEYGRTVDVV